MRRVWRLRLATLAVALAGVGAFRLAGLPLPFLLGPLFACLCAALAGAPMRAPPLVGTLMRTVLGVAVGTALTPALVERLPAMAASLALIPLFVLVMGAAGYPFFRLVLRYDHPTAYYGAMPGGFQDMLVFGQEAGANVRTLSLIHATRVLVIVSVAPFLITQVWGLPLAHAPGEPAASIPVSELALMAAAAVGGWWVAARVGLFGATIIGPMVAAAGLSLAGLLHHRPPVEAILAAQFFIGLSIGVNYSGVTLGEVRRDVAAGAAFCLILGAISVVFAEIVSLGGIAPPVEAFLAFAPGGQAEMAVLAIVAGADLAFVVTHHLLRLVLIILLAPLVARLVRRWV